jgi:cold shock protein
METGKIKFYNPTKGFGFIKRDAGGEDLFFHINNVMEGIMAEQLQENVAVSFIEEEGRKGSQAGNVNLVGGAAEATYDENDA